MNDSDILESQRRYFVSIKASKNIKALVPPQIPRNISIDKVFFSLDKSIMTLVEYKSKLNLIQYESLFTRTLIRSDSIASVRLSSGSCSLLDLLIYEEYPVWDTVDLYIRYAASIASSSDSIHKISREQKHLSLGMIRKLHSLIVPVVKKSNSAGRFRTSQTWVGSHRIETAKLIPPPISYLSECLQDLEDFLHESSENENVSPLFIRIALVHAQIEMIQPFEEDSSVIASFLSNSMFIMAGLPPVYMSTFWELYRAKKIPALCDIFLKGNWVEWLNLYLNGIRIAAENNITTLNLLDLLLRKWENTLHKTGRYTGAFRLLGFTVVNPVFRIKTIQQVFNISYQAAHFAINRLLKTGILEKIVTDTGNVLFISRESLEIFELHGTKTN